MVLTSRGAEQQSHGVDNVLAFINVALALGKVGTPFSGYGTITGQGNGQGGREHGQKADQLPGYRRIDDPRARRDVAAVWGIPEGDLPGPGKSAYELIESAGEPGRHPRAARHRIESASSRRRTRRTSRPGSSASIFSPSPISFCRRRRAWRTSCCRRRSGRRRTAPSPISKGASSAAGARSTPPPQVRTDIDFLCDLAGALGKSQFFTFEDHQAVFEELRAATRGGAADYSGISYERIDREGGVFWPCPSDDHPGTPRLFEETFPTRAAARGFTPIEHGGPAEVPDEHFPLYLTTGRVLAHYQSGTQTRRVPQLMDAAPEPIAEMHPQLAKRHGLADGAPVVLRTRRGSATFTSRITADIRPDTVFVPFHWPDESSANRLTNDALDPVSRMPEFKVCAARIDTDE